MTRARIVPVIIVALAAVLLTGATGCNKNISTELPDELLALLPAQPALMVSLSSLEDYEARRAALADSSTGAPPILPGGVLDEVDLAELLRELLPAADAVVDPARPIALAMGLPAPMTNQLDMVLVLPVLADAEPGELVDGDTFKSQLMGTGYVALSSGAAYAAADSVPGLARDRLPGVVSMAVDLEGILKMYGPFIQMGLAAATAQTADPDNPDAPATGMSPEQMAATADMVKLVVEAARRLDLSMDLDAEQLTLDSRFDMVPGAALVPGPQPDFARALALSGSLPTDAHLKFAVAVDQTQQMEMSMDYYKASMAADLKKLPPELADGIAAWFEGYVETMRFMSAPMAVGLGMGVDGIEAQIVVETAEADAFLDHIDRQLTTLGKLEIGLTVTAIEPLDLTGVMVRGWDLSWDDDLLAGVMDAAAVTGTAPTGGQLAQTLGLLRRLAPGMRAFSVGDQVVVTTATAWEDLGVVLGDIRDPRAADDQLVTLAAGAGPATQEAVQGNLGLILVWFMEAMGVGDETMLESLRSEPLEITMAMTMDGPRTGNTMTLGVQGLRRAVEAVSALGEQMQGE